MLQNELLASTAVAALVAFCIVATVNATDAKSRAMRRKAVFKSALISFAATFAVAYYITHPPKSDPIRHCITSDPDF